MDNNPTNNMELKGKQSSLNHEKKMEKYNIDHKSAKIVIILAILIDVFGFTMILPLLPFVAKNTFGASNFQIGLIIASNAFMTLIFAPLWGKLSDKFGRKPILIISQMGTFTAFMMLALSSSVEMLFLSRMVDGIFGGNWPMVKAIISDEVPPKDRGLQMTNVGVVHVLAGLVGPGLGGILSIIRLLGPEYPIAAAGFVAAGLSLTSLLITIIFVKESWPKERRLTAEKVIKIKNK